MLKHITSTGRGGKGDQMMKRGAESSGELTILFERNQRSKFPNFARQYCRGHVLP